MRALAWPVAATAGALLPARGALTAAALAGLVALAFRRATPVWWLVVLLLASGLAQRSLDGLDGLDEQVVVDDVTLVSDPAPHFGGVRAEVRWAGRRVQLRASGRAATDLHERLAGEVVAVRGTARPLAEGERWLVARHVAGVLQVHQVDGWEAGDPASRMANALRRVLASGAEPMGERARSLYTGIVIGDDRAQPVDLADAFEGAGLTHLLAVSGQNVAFALAVAGPALRRARLWPRLLLTLGTIAFFALLTRFEPSVVRASAMAAVAAGAALPGRPTSRLHTMAVAITGLVLVDPLLVRSVGFRLSAGASVAIVLLARPLAARLRGPQALRDALGVTIAAQLGVAPVLLMTFGPIPLASLPANLLAVPVAGFVMVWGLTAGLAAGVLGEPVAALLHVPTRSALAWLELVAERSAHAPLGELGAPQVLAVALGLALTGLAAPRWRAVGALVSVAAVGSALVLAQAPAPLRQSLAPGVVRWNEGGTDVVVLGGVGGRTSLSSAAVLAELRRAGVGAIDLLVVADATVADDLIALVAASHPVGVVRGLSEGAGTLQVGALVVEIVAVPERLVVDARPRAP